MSRKVAVLLLLVVSLGFAHLTRNWVVFPDTIMVGTDTMWSSRAVQIAGTPYERLHGATFKIHAWSNDTCALSAYFKIVDTKDTLLMDSLAYSPPDAPGDSTIFIDWVVPTSAASWGSMVVSDVGQYILVGLYLTGEATDSMWISTHLDTKPYLILDVGD